MSGRRVAAIARRIAEQFRRDRPTLGLVFVAPIVILALLGWVLRDQHTPTTRLGIVNLAGAPGEVIAQGLATAARGGGVTVVDVGTGPNAADDAIRSDRADLVVVLPAGFAPSPPGSTPIELVTPGVSPGEDAARIGELQRIVTRQLPGGGVQIARRAVYGSGNDDALNTFAPALLGFFGFFFVFILTGISFLRERVGGTFERLLATPVARSEIVLGYSIGFTVFAALQVTLILLFALSSLAFSVGGVRVAVGLGIPSAGAPILAFLVVVLLAIGAVNLGIFLSTFARTELQIFQFIPIVIVPQGLLGGVFWSISSLPDPLQAISRVLPLTYAIEGLRGVLIKGAGLDSGTLQTDVLVLAGFAVFFVAIASLTIRREVA
jgi:ABC-2 type transport system permease protein